MKCPVCVEQGERSTVTAGIASETLMYAAPYYDEDGRYHHHDPNTVTTEYRCSMGHTFVTKSGHRCPSCDYGRDDDNVTVKEPR